jgi:hypothetical protein
MCLVIGQSPLRRKIGLTHPSLVPVTGNLLWMHLILRMLRRERKRGRERERKRGRRREGESKRERKTKRNKQIKKNEM